MFMSSLFIRNIYFLFLYTSNYRSFTPLSSFFNYYYFYLCQNINIPGFVNFRVLSFQPLFIKSKPHRHIMIILTIDLELTQICIVVSHSKYFLIDIFDRFDGLLDKLNIKILSSIFTSIKKCIKIWNFTQICIVVSYSKYF